MTQESTQQLAMSRFRAVEHGRAVVQVSTVGVSGIISPNGVFQDTTGLFTAEQMVEALPLRTTLTLADRLGQWPALVTGLLAAAAVVAGVVASSRRAREVRDARRRASARRRPGDGGRGARRPAVAASRGGSRAGARTGSTTRGGGTRR
jgi:apolipoprotein N-acyltransferase